MLLRSMIATYDVGGDMSVYIVFEMKKQMCVPSSAVYYVSRLMGWLNCSVDREQHSAFVPLCLSFDQVTVVTLVGIFPLLCPGMCLVIAT